MSGFGFSPSDVIKLVEITTRVYIAFKGMSLLTHRTADRFQVR